MEAHVALSARERFDEVDPLPAWIVTTSSAGSRRHVAIVTGKRVKPCGSAASGACTQTTCSRG
jgi:hypothetical protein